MADTAVEEQPTHMPTVARCVESCLHSFQQCLCKAASVHVRELSLVEDQLARFSIWTANIRVFVPGRGSLDHRLREAPDVQDAVASLLEALNYSLQNCRLGQLRLGSRILESLHPETSDDSLGAINEKFDQSVRGIANEISLLHRFSNTIRRASRETQNVKAAKTFRIRDDEGNDVEPFLQELFANHIRDRFPGVSDNIRQRLASTMLLRRKRILYRRHRYGKTTIRPQEVPSQPSLTRPIARTWGRTLDHPEEPARKQVTLTPSRSVVQSLTQTATTLSPESFQKASGPSVVSVSKTVALSNHEELPFPLAPCSGLLRKYRQLRKQREEKHKVDLEFLTSNEEQSGQPHLYVNLISAAEAEHKETLEQDWNDCLRAIGEVTCPFCFYALPAQDATDEKKWKLHVKNDLDPYVCLFEECDSPEELYNHSDVWLKHMRQHALRWRCISKSHIEFVGTTRDEYLSHMRTAHPRKFTDAQLGVLADRNGWMVGPLFTSCTLCGIEKVDGNIEDHIVGHLRSPALKSLPGYEEEGLDDLESQEGSVATSRPQSRSTIKLEPERHIPVTFSDLQVLWAKSDPGSSKYEPWGGFRNYIAQFPEGQRLPTQTTDSSLLTDATETSLTPQLPPPLQLNWEEEPGLYDPSIEFVEDGLFDGVSNIERRLFEWGFIPDAHRSAEGLEDDPILQEFLRNSHVSSRMDPNCAICDGLAITCCDCEAKALDVAVRQAEMRMMQPLCNDIRKWVREHSQHTVLRGFEAHYQKLRESSAKVPQPALMEADPTAQTASSGQAENEILWPLTQQEVNESWKAAVQSYPETLEYFYGLVDLNLPTDDDQMVRDPPLSAIPLSQKRRLSSSAAGLSRNSESHRKSYLVDGLSKSGSREPAHPPKRAFPTPFHNNTSTSFTHE
ncbi:hypothetical protein B7463_g890, partial [Scytalidium lignicola]